MSDPCECLFSHEALMRRLLSALRDTQTECTDTDCDTSTGLSGGSSFGLPMLLALWGIAALVLFLTRPASMRMLGDRQANEKQRNSGRDNQDPPAPDVH
ncbi:Small integral membrane protein 14 [Aphelenchoides besseyi]|nr:Small integral membrane protein 14 [Aphelenchoides besseyi]